MRSVNISQLKDRLNEYLQQVRKGEEIIIRYRNRPIAKIVPLDTDALSEEECKLVAAGLMRPAKRPLPASFWSLPAPRVSSRRAVAALNAVRRTS